MITEKKGIAGFALRLLFTIISLAERVVIEKYQAQIYMQFMRVFFEYGKENKVR